MTDEYHVVSLFSVFMFMICVEVCNLLCTPFLLDSGFTWWWLYKDTASDKLIIIELNECFVFYIYMIKHNGKSQLNNARKVLILQTQPQWCLWTSATYVDFVWNEM